MLDLPLKTAENAPEESVSTLEAVEKAYGFVPNLIGTLANAPAAAKGYMAVSEAFASSSLTAVEQQIVLLTVSFENRCHYCVAAHTLAARAAGAEQDTIDGLRDGNPLGDDRLEALRAFTTSVVRNRGWSPANDVEAFLNAGFTPEQVLEVVTGVTQKTLSNYVNHLASTPLDDAFAKAEWSHPAERATSAV